MIDRSCPSLKTRALGINRSDKNSEIYVIPMNRKNVWTNK